MQKPTRISRPFHQDLAMDTRAVVPPQPRGGGKVQGEVPRKNQRVALGDKINVEAGQVKIKGKAPVQITQPIIRRFHAQLLTNNVQKKNVNQVPGVADQAAQNGKCFSARNARREGEVCQ